MNTVIPKGDYETGPSPCWLPRKDRDGKWCKPLIRCQCGHISGISLHHVHADGTVTASFFHDAAPHPEINYPGGGCGWHVFLTLADYDCGDFPPEPYNG